MLPNINTLHLLYQQHQKNVTFVTIMI